MTIVPLHAPISGWAMPLAEVPDPVFAERMMGDGVAIDPLDGILRAPCDADVVGVAAPGHSVTLELVNGAQILIHLGLETVALAGKGFSVEVAAGQRVRTGDPLIRVDLEVVACAGKSLVTPIVVINEGYAVRAVACDRTVAAGELLMEVERSQSVAAGVELASGASAECDIVIPMAHGLHARPSARIVAALKPFQADVRFVAHGRTANARSVVALLSLGLVRGDRLTVAATGADAPEAVAAVADLIGSGMGEAHIDPIAPAQARAQEPVPLGGEGPLFTGVRAAPGLAAGPLVKLVPAEFNVPEEGLGPEEEAAALDDARASLSLEMMTESAGEAASIAAVHQALLDDPELRAGALGWITRGKSAAFAWRAAIRAKSDSIQATGNPLLIERIADLADVEQRVVARILGAQTAPAQALPDGAILVADELLPSQFLALDPARLGGIATARGGPTAHVAILAASAGVPMLVAIGPGLLRLPDGARAILDADTGSLDAEPSAEALERTAERIRASTARRKAEAALAAADCVMADGTRIEIFANLASAADAARAVALGAEGCGLLRTEFLFLDRTEPPTEEEQRKTYAAVATALEGRPLIVRTLDVGADKPVPYLPREREENPALGCRGIRLSLDRPDLLAAQFRAILTGVPAEQCRIMLPMVVDRSELRAVRAIFDEAAQAVGAGPVPLGVMIETPAAALLADSIAAEADFLSIGTNDLSQYALAADRGNPAVAAMVDALHPAVLRLIAAAAKGAARHGRWIGVCGGLASDPGAAALLIGLGVTELSAAPAAVAELKERVRTLTLDGCRELADRALAAATVQEVRAMLEGEV